MSPGPRLAYRDYGAAGFYFVTICADFKRCLFGAVVDREVRLSRLGAIVREGWLAIPEHLAGVQVHEFVVMPNHLHGIVEIAVKAEDRSKTKTAQYPAPLQRHGIAREKLGAGSLPVIVRSFKAAVARWAHVEMNWQRGIWQRGYFDRVIRDGEEFSDVTRYMAENPLRWGGKVERAGEFGERLRGS